jgi:hypothetical protein
MNPERDGDRVAARSTVHDLDFLSHYDTARARLEAAQAGLAAGVLDSGWNRDFVILAAIQLIDAALADLAVA